MPKTTRSRKRGQLAKSIKKRFIRGLIRRKEAARSTNGRLPAGATHEIVEQGKELPTVRRRRFSLI